MTTIKKRVNITVKKAPTPFQFPESEPKKEPEPEPKQNVAAAVAPAKRRRGRPRKTEQVGSESTTQRVTNVTETKSASAPKKRGRKTRAASTKVDSEVNDKVYSLFSGKKSVDIDNLENFSYIVNLKIPKTLADDIHADLQRTKLGKGSEAGAGCETQQYNLPLPSREAIKSFNNICGKNELPSIYKITYPKIDRRRVQVHSGNTSFRKAPNTGSIVQNLENMEQVTVRTQMSSGLSACYVDYLMPGFAMGDRWPTRSDYPCRNCGESFTNTPVGLVSKIDGDVEVDPQNCKFHMYYNFCSWPCAFRYAEDRFPNPTQQQSWLNFCYNTVQKQINPSHKWSKIQMAPPLDSLRKNGGRLSIEQYREATNSNKSYNVYLPPLIPLKMTLEENARDMTTHTSTATTPGNMNSMRTSRGKKFVPMDASRIKKAEMSIRTRKNSTRNAFAIDKLMKVEIKTTS